MRSDVGREQVERAARLYKTSGEAARALGISSNTFGRRCKEEGIETPFNRARRKKGESQKGAEETRKPHVTRSMLRLVCDTFDFNRTAAWHLGVSERTFVRWCKEEDIETPAQRWRREKEEYARFAFLVGEEAVARRLRRR